MAERQRGERGAKEGVNDAAATVVASETPAQAEITAIKTRITELHARDAVRPSGKSSVDESRSSVSRCSE
jgi:hypothetical protein